MEEGFIVVKGQMWGGGVKVPRGKCNKKGGLKPRGAGKYGSVSFPQILRTRKKKEDVLQREIEP